MLKQRKHRPPKAGGPRGPFFFVLWVAAALLILAGAAGLLYLSHGSLRFARGAQLLLCRQEEGLLASWPAVPGAEAYQVRAESAGQDAPLVDARVEGTDCLLPAVTAGELKIRVQPVRARQKGAARTWTVKEMAEAAWPVLDAFAGEVEAATKDLRFTWEGSGGDVRLLYQEGPEGVWRRTAQQDGTLPVGGEGAIPLPAYGETLRFAGRYGRAAGDIVFCSALSGAVSFRRSDFLDTVIQLSAQPEGDNIYTFSWNEAKGDHYLLQYATDDTAAWAELLRVECAENPQCRLKLTSGTHYRLRVVTQEAGAEGYVSSSAEMELETGLSTLYATVWPIEDLELYADASRQQAVGTAPAATACCVLREEAGMFYVRTGDGYGYIDGNFCLINLPDYIGELCAYNITNSYDSLYMVHGYEIPEVTGTVITGYESIRTGEGRYLVPLLYPCAQKLAAAARSALADGYRLKIYDAYRPREASMEIYHIAEQHLQDPIPDETYTGVPADDLPAGIPLYSEVLAQMEQAGLTVPAAPQEGAEPAPAPPAGENGWLFWEAEEEAAPSSSAPAAEPAPQPAPAAPQEEALPAPEAEEAEPELPQYLTYYLLMTDGRYRLGSFLARVGSTHNLGIAMDLTLERTDTREELEMQTAMHDLSHYSVLQRNNENADLLAEYMLGAGFAPLSSEWWHFQDDATRDALGLKTYQEKGVTPEGWHHDLNGWYYCQADGARVRFEHDPA